MRLKQILMAGLVALGMMGSSLVASASVNVETTETEKVEIEEKHEDGEGVTIYGKLYLIRTTQVFCYDSIENISNSFKDINYTVLDNDGNEVFKGNLEENMNKEFTMYDGIAFEMKVPEWKEGSKYKVAFENLPVYYSEYLLAARTNKESNQVETTMNANGSYDAIIDIEYFLFVSDYTDPTTGKTTKITQEMGVNNTISFKYGYKEKGKKHSYFSVIDEKDNLIPNVEIVMKTNKGEYRSNIGKTGIGQMTGYSAGENIKQWDIYYNNVLLKSVENTINRRTSNDINLFGIKLIGIDVSELQRYSNWLVATVTNPEKVDFSLIGDNGTLGIVLDITNEAGEVKQVVVNSTGETVLLEQVEKGTYTISVANANGMNFEIDNNVVNLEGRKGITIRLKAKKVLGLTNKVEDKENAFNYKFDDDSRLSGISLSSDYTKYYAVPDDSEFIIVNTDTNESYNVNFTIGDLKRVKMLNLADGTITESESVIVNDNIFNPDTFDEFWCYVILGVLSVIGLGLLCRNRD